MEVAALVTDFELNQLGDGIDVVIKPPAEALEQMDDFVRDMHTTSGLITELDSGVTLQEAEHIVLDYVRTFVPEPRKAPLGGNTVATDRGFLSRDMPVLESYLHYRIIDVCSIKELSRRWYPRVYFNAPKKSGGHRALADIRESIAELRYYREAVFVPQPGPDTRHREGARDARTSSSTDPPTRDLRRHTTRTDGRMPSRRGGHEHLARACTHCRRRDTAPSPGPGSCCAWWV